MAKLNAKNVAKYSLLPGIIPRLQHLCDLSFGHLAYFVAFTYNMVGLLPKTHPYLQPANIGRYGVHQVVIQAADRLVVKKENIDQVVIFILTLAGMILLGLQLLFLIGGFAFQSAHAQVFQGIFGTPNPNNDIAFIMMDYVFGVPDIFQSCVAQGIPCFPNVANYTPPTNVPFPSPFHFALHDLFQFYSLGVLMVAVIIFLYYIFVAVAETAQTGVPFGQRFANGWVPVRLIVAIGLLLPISFGLNSAQYIVLHAAKWGSGFATNGWNIFTRTSILPVDMNGESLIAIPNRPMVSSLIEFMAVAKACHAAYEKAYTGTDHQKDYDIRPYIVQYPADAIEVTPGAPSWPEILQFSEFRDVHLVFGHLSAVEYKTDAGNVRPYCGELVIPVKQTGITGVGVLQAAYLNIVRTMWFNDQDFENFGRRFAELNIYPADPCVVALPGDTNDPNLTPSKNCGLPDQQMVQEIFDGPEEQFRIAVQTARDQIADDIRDGDLAEFTQDAADYGWGGAGIWYNHISELNGAFATSVQAVPTIKQLPYLINEVARQKTQENSSVSAEDLCKPETAQGMAVKFESYDKAVSRAICGAMSWWKDSQISIRRQETPADNPIVATITRIFGINGILSLADNEAVHPMAQMSMVGRSMMHTSIQSIFVGAVTGLAGGALAGSSDLASLLFTSFSGITMAIAVIGASIGMLLGYIIPFMPFLYFFFAMAGWVKGIFEAMVGAPLWALAHLRIDGDGLPGPKAMDGYFLIFEIFLRPILIVFGMLASIATFSALVRVLNQIWQLVTTNLTSFDRPDIDPIPVAGNIQNIPQIIENFERFSRGHLDQLFFTVMYAVIAYILATSSFKLIDLIPQQITRWMGGTAQAFNDNRGDALREINQPAVAGTYFATSQISKGLGDMSKGLGSTASGTGELFENFRVRMQTGTSKANEQAAPVVNKLSRFLGFGSKNN